MIKKLSDVLTVVSSAKASGHDHSDQIAFIASRCGMALDGHGCRVGVMAAIIGDAIPDITQEDALMAGQMHDIGKLLIPSTVLDHNGPLSETQKAIMQGHPEYGHSILTATIGLPSRHVINDACLYHHERWAGAGYPHIMSGENIPMIARIVTIADIIDALVSERSYKPGWEWPRVIDLIKKEAGKALDPRLVGITMDRIDEIITARADEKSRQKTIMELSARVAEATQFHHPIPTASHLAMPPKEPRPYMAARKSPQG